MSIYQKSIIQLLGCSSEDAKQVEELMRTVIFHSTLDWQSNEQFNQGANEAWELLQYMRSPAGQDYLKTLENDPTAHL